MYLLYAVRARIKYLRGISASDLLRSLNLMATQQGLNNFKVNQQGDINMSSQITSQLTNQDFIFNSIKIRVKGTYEEPLFCLADVCKVLNLTNARGPYLGIKFKPK